MNIYQEVKLREGERIAPGKRIGGDFGDWICFGVGSETVTIYFAGKDIGLAEKIDQVIRAHRGLVNG